MHGLNALLLGWFTRIRFRLCQWRVLVHVQRAVVIIMTGELWDVCWEYELLFKFCVSRVFCVISCYIGPLYNGTRLYCTRWIQYNQNKTKKVYARWFIWSILVSIVEVHDMPVCAMLSHENLTKLNHIRVLIKACLLLDKAVPQHSYFTISYLLPLVWRSLLIRFIATHSYAGRTCVTLVWAGTNS